jgi:hypothetical protein
MTEDYRHITIPIPYIGPSLNKIYAGMHYSKRKRNADEAHLIVKMACKGIKSVSNPVSLTFTPYHNSRLYDCSNYAYTCKLIEDGLVQAGVLVDDTNKYVKQIIINAPVKIAKTEDNYTMVRIKVLA